MSSSIYHFFQDLVDKKTLLEGRSNLESFPFDDNLISFRRKGSFPDIGIRICKDNNFFQGGELVEIKDCDSFNIASFNSTFPKGKTEIKSEVTSKSDACKQMKQVGENLEDLAVRQVYYLIRGKLKKEPICKVILVHGSFFDVIDVDGFIKKSFIKVFEGNLKRHNYEMTDEINELIKVFSPNQNDFSQTRQIDNYPVSIRFRIMLEASTESNLLNSAKYPQIKNNTINLILPSTDFFEDLSNIERMEAVFGKEEFNLMEKSTAKNPFGEEFTVFQTTI